MKKLYLFIFLIVIVSTQSQLTKAYTKSSAPSGKRFGLIAQTITFPAFTATQTYGAADVALSATASSSLAVTYTSSNPLVATIVSGKIHIVGIGNSVISATQAGDATYSSAVPVSQTVTVNPTLAFANIGSKAFSTTNFAFAAATSNFPVATAPMVYTTSDATVATVVNGQLHYVGLGSCTITAYQAPLGNSVNYTPVTASSSVTVTLGTAPTLTFSTASIALQTADQTLGATSSFATNPAYPITYTTSSNPAVATIVNNRIHLLAVGSTIITATQPGNGRFTDATPVQATINVTAPAAPSFSNSIGSKTIGIADFDPGATFAANAYNATITYSNTNNIAAFSIINNKVHLNASATATVSPNAPITATITYPIAAGGTATVATTNTTMSIALAAATSTSPVINFTALGSKVFNTVDLVIGATSTSSTTAPIIYTSNNPAVATIVNGNIHFVGLGTTTIEASQQNTPVQLTPLPTIVAPATATLPADVTSVLTVSAPTIAVTAPGAKLTTAADFAPASTPTLLSVPVTYSVSPASIAVMANGLIHLTGGIGTATITASQSAAAAAAGLPVPADATNTFVVSAPTVPVITFAALGSKPMQPDLAPGATTTVASPAITYTSSNPAVATIVNGLIHFVGAPAAPNNTTVITASQGGGTTGSVSLPADVQNVLTVTPALITFPALGTRAFTSVDYAPGATSSLGTTVNYTSSNPAVATIVAGNIHSVGAGTTTITATQGGGANGTATLPADVSQVLTITAPSINFPTLGTKQFTSTDINPGATGTYINLNSIATITFAAGSGYTNGIYYNVPLTGGTGTGATATVTVINGVVTAVAITNAGSFYTATNVLTAAAGSVGATGTGFTVTVATVSVGVPVTYTSGNPAVATIVNGLIHFNSAPAAPNDTVTITASQRPLPGVNTGTLVFPPSVSQVMRVTSPTITFTPTLTRAASLPDINPGAVSTLTNIPIKYTSSNTAVATITNNIITSLGSLKGGANYVNGLYTNIALTGGTGTGAIATIFVNGGAITSVNLTSTGANYTIGDVLTCPSSSIGGNGSGFSISVLNASALLHFTGVGTTTLLASQGGGSTGTTTLPADASQVLTVTAPVITFPALGTKTLPQGDLAPGATSTNTSIPVTYSIPPPPTNQPVVATILNNSIISQTLVSGGAGYSDFTWTNVPLAYPTGVTGAGTGARATVVVAGTVVTSVTITSGGTGYVTGETLTTDPSNLGGVQGSSSGFSIRVTNAGGVIHFVGAGTAVVTATQGGGTAGTIALPADVSQTLTVAPYVLKIPGISTRQFTDVDFNPQATSTLTTTAISYSSATPAVATTLQGSITSITALAGGLGYTTGTYYSVPLTYPATTGTGSGAVANIVVANGTVTAVNMITGGSNYKTGDILTCAATSIGGGGTSFSFAVGTVGSVVHYAAAAVAPNNTSVITASQGGGTLGTSALPPDVSSTLTLTPATITFPPIGTKTFTTTDLALGATSTIVGKPITYTISPAAPTVATIVNGNLHFVGAGTATVVASQGGGSTGTTTLPADVSQTVTVTAPVITFAATSTKAYTNVDFDAGASSPVTSVPIVYTSSNTAVATVVSTLTLASNITGGSGYTNTVTPLTGVPLTGGKGTGAQASITITNGVVSLVTITASGNGYVAGDVLTANAAGMGPGSGFSAVVNGYSSLIHLNPSVPAAPNNTTVIKASQGGGATGTASLPADVSQVLTVNGPAITFPATASVAYNNIDYNPGATSTVSLPITYTSSNLSVATIVNGNIHIIGAPTGSNTTVITASQGGGTTGLPGIPADAKQTLTVTPAGAPAITFVLPTSIAFNNTDLAPGATSTLTTKPVSYTSSNANVATIVNGNIHFVGLGSVQITASQGGLSAANGIPADVSQTFTVTAPTITLAATASKALTTTDFNPGATTTLTGTPITYTSSNPLVATIVNGNVHLVGTTGTTVIEATQQNSPVGTIAPVNGLLPADQVQTLTVTAPTALTFTTTQLPASIPFQVIDRAPGATSTAYPNLPITYTSSDPSVATIVNGNIHFVGLGNTTITASQQAAANAAGYQSPPDISLTTTVAAPTITFASASVTALGARPFNSTDLAITAVSTLNSTAPITFTSSDPTVATIVNGNLLRCVGIGNCYITASQAAYPGAPAPLSVTTPCNITPATLTMAATPFGIKPINTADATIVPTVTLATTVTPVTYVSSDPTVATVSSAGVIHILSTGVTNITASQLTTANYAPLPTTQTLTVVSVQPTATPLISFKALGTQPYSNSGDIAPGATSTLSVTTNPITYTSSNPAVATILNGNIHLTPPVVINGVVTYPANPTTIITASQGGGANGVNGVLPADVSVPLTIAPASIVFPPLGTQKFNSIDLNPGATSTYINTILQNGTYINLPITYTSSDPTVATIVNGNIHFVGLGSTNITASLGNVIVPDVTQILTVVAPAITFPTTNSRTFSSADIPPGATSTVNNLPITYTSSNPSVATIVNGNLHFTGMGITTITASQAASGSTIPAITASQVLTVTAPTLTFPGTPSPKAFSLIDLDPGATSTLTATPISYTSSNTALVSIVNNKLHFNLPSGPVTNNTTVITATQAGIGNIPTQSITLLLTVNQAIIFPNLLTKAYGDPDFSPAFSTYGSAFPVTYTSATTATATVVTTNGLSMLHIVAPGSSVITGNQSPIDGVTTAATAVTATLTVTQAPMVITPKNVTIPYGIQGPVSLPLTYTGFKSASGTAPLDDSTKFSTQPTVNIVGLSPNGNFSTIPVGTYQLTAAGAVSTLYSFTYGTGTLTVAAATQTLSWDSFNGNRHYGDADFDPLARSTGDPVAYTIANPAVAVMLNGKLHIVGAGTTTITASIPTISPSNYLPTTATITKTLVVAKGSQTITVGVIPDLVRNSPAYTPVASASSGLPLTLTVIDPVIAKPVGLSLLPLHVGVTFATFIQPGDNNWLPDTSAVQYVNVIDPTGAPVTVHQAVSPDGDGINDFLYIEGIQNYATNHVKIINRNGDNVFERDNYDNKTVIFTGKSKSNGNLPAGVYFYLVDYTIGGAKYHVTGYFVLKY